MGQPAHQLDLHPGNSVFRRGPGRVVDHAHSQDAVLDPVERATGIAGEIAGQQSSQEEGEESTCHLDYLVIERPWLVVTHITLIRPFPRGFCMRPRTWYLVLAI